MLRLRQKHKLKLRERLRRRLLNGKQRRRLQEKELKRKKLLHKLLLKLRLIGSRLNMKLIKREEMKLPLLKLPPSRLLMKLPRRHSRKPKQRERTKKKDKLLILPPRCLNVKTNSKPNMSMFGLLDHQEFQ